MEFYAAERKKKLIPFAMAWMELESIMLSEIIQAVRDKYHTMSPLRGKFLLKNILFINFLGRVEKGKRKRGRETLTCGRNIDQLPLTCAPTRDQTHNPGTCPDGESNWRPFTLWDDAQPTEPSQAGQGNFLDKDKILTTGRKYVSAEQLVQNRENGVTLVVSKVYNPW